MINVGLFGGLGNQLFQYAVGRAMEERGHEVTFEKVKLFDGDGPHHRDHSLYGLDGFNTKVKFGTPIGPVYSDWNNPGGLPYRPEVLNLPAPHTLTGHWQSEKYFYNIADKLRAELTLKNPVSDRVAELAYRIQNSNSVCLHVRRGDYTLPENVTYHGNGGPHYYPAAIAYITERVSCPTFFTFSDDTEWCKSNMPGEVVEGNSRFEDFYLMSLCKHGVIANSTFSWWANWQGDDKPDRIVIGPRDWFVTKELDARDIIPERWVKL